MKGEADGTYAGTMWQARNIEAVRMILSGPNASQYTLLYRVYQTGIGWSNWVTEGGDAGLTGRNLPIESIEVQLS